MVLKLKNPVSGKTEMKRKRKKNLMGFEPLFLTHVDLLCCCCLFISVSENYHKIAYRISDPVRISSGLESLFIKITFSVQADL